MTDDEAPELKRYKVILNGTPTNVQLTEEDFKSQGWVLAEGDTHHTRDQGTKDGTGLVTSSKAGGTVPNKARRRGEAGNA